MASPEQLYAEAKARMASPKTVEQDGLLKAAAARRSEQYARAQCLARRMPEVLRSAGVAMNRELVSYDPPADGRRRRRSGQLPVAALSPAGWSLAEVARQHTAKGVAIGGILLSYYGDIWTYDAVIPSSQWPTGVTQRQTPNAWGNLTSFNDIRDPIEVDRAVNHNFWYGPSGAVNVDDLDRSIRSVSGSLTLEELLWNLAANPAANIPPHDLQHLGLAVTADS